MSNALAIASVTQTLVELLSGALPRSGVSGATVTALRPDASAGLPNPGVNIFLYQVAPSPSLRNEDLPTRRADGTLLKRPQAALDLYYLLTFYGDDTTLDQQRLLGAAVSTIHAQPVLTRAAVQSAVANSNFLQGSDLAQQADLVRFSPVNFSLEEFSKLWSVFLKTDYVLSVAYMGCTVLIQTDDPEPPPPLPVLAPMVAVLPLRQPVIASVAEASGGPIVSGSTLTISGRNLLLDPASAGGLGMTQVQFGTVVATPGVASATQLTVALPAGLAAGIQPIQLIPSVALGNPATPHAAGFQSNLASFVLHPVIVQSGKRSKTYAIKVSTGSGSPPATTLQVQIDPLVQPGQQAVLELHPAASPGTLQLFQAPPITAASDTLSFPVSGLASGSYLVRVRIDGAESPFQLNAAGQPVAPQVTL